MTWRKTVLDPVFLAIKKSKVYGQCQVVKVSKPCDVWFIFLCIKFYSIPSLLKLNMLGETHATLTTTILFSRVERCTHPLLTCHTKRW